MAIAGCVAERLGFPPDFIRLKKDSAKNSAICFLRQLVLYLRCIYRNAVIVEFKKFRL
jgi:hypothetical protein